MHRIQLFTVVVFNGSKHSNHIPTLGDCMLDFRSSLKTALLLVGILSLPGCILKTVDGVCDANNASSIFEPELRSGKYGVTIGDERLPERANTGVNGESEYAYIEITPEDNLGRYEVKMKVKEADDDPRETKSMAYTCMINDRRFISYFDNESNYWINLEAIPENETNFHFAQIKLKDSPDCYDRFEDTRTKTKAGASSPMAYNIEVTAFEAFVSCFVERDPQDQSKLRRLEWFAE